MTSQKRHTFVPAKHSKFKPSPYWKMTIQALTLDQLRSYRYKLYGRSRRFVTIAWQSSAALSRAQQYSAMLEYVDARLVKLEKQARR